MRDSLKDVRAQFLSERMLCFETSKGLDPSEFASDETCVLLRLLEKDDAVAAKCFSRVDLCCGVIMLLEIDFR